MRTTGAHRTPQSTSAPSSPPSSPDAQPPTSFSDRFAARNFRQVTLLCLAAWVLFRIFYAPFDGWILTHSDSPHPGSGIQNPALLSLHGAGWFFIGLGILWCVISARQRGITDSAWFAFFSLAAGFIGLTWMTPGVLDAEYRNGIGFKVATESGLVLLAIVFLVTPRLPRLVMGTDHTSRPPRIAKAKSLLPVSLRVELLVLSAVLLCAWGISAWTLQREWQPSQGFSTNALYAAGSPLPFLAASFALMLFHQFPMTQVARRILFWLLIPLQGLALVLFLVSGPTALLAGGTDALLVAMVLVQAAAHAWWIWTTIHVCRPLFGWRVHWQSPSQGL